MLELPVKWGQVRGCSVATRTVRIYLLTVRLVVILTRSRYPRKSREQRASVRASMVESDSNTGHIDASSTSAQVVQASPPDTGTSASVDPDTASDHCVPTPERGNTFFFGESNLLTYVTGPPSGNDPAGNKDFVHKQRLSYPLSTTPREHMENISSNHVESNREKYLRQSGAFNFPEPENCLPAIRAYFAWFHPCFPILDRAEIAHRINTRDISPLLLQALLFIGTNYSDERSVFLMGFKDRSEAKYLLYNRAKLLFEADWEQDHITTLQALFLMSFWRGSRSTARDVRYWLGVAITQAQLCGLHRS